MTFLRPKKSLGQHFLKDKNIAAKIAGSLRAGQPGYPTEVIEVGPGTGVLTEFLVQKEGIRLWLVEVDARMVEHLREHFPELGKRIVHDDFLKVDIHNLIRGNEQVSVIGNFPYHISSPILFRVLAQRARIREMVGMFQKEVAERVAAKPRTKAYGIPSVLVQAFYDVKVLFSVSGHVFYPPPKVNSAVIRLERKKNESLGCDEALFTRVVKEAFGKRRKVLRNALKPRLGGVTVEREDLLSRRAEELTVEDFVYLTNALSGNAQREKAEVVSAE